MLHNRAAPSWVWSLWVLSDNERHYCCVNAAIYLINILCWCKCQLLFVWLRNEVQMFYGIRTHRLFTASKAKQSPSLASKAHGVVLISVVLACIPQPDSSQSRKTRILGEGIAWYARLLSCIHWYVYFVFSLFCGLFSFVDFPSVLWYWWLGLLTCKNHLPYTVLAGT